MIGGTPFSGWRLGMIFEKGEPENTEYAVEVFPKGSEDDRRPEADAEEYGEYCEAAGWKLVDSRKKFCVFRKIREDAVPIVTEEERIENVCKAEFRYRLKRLPCLLFGTWTSWMNFLTGRAENWLFSNLMMTTFLLLNLLVVMEVGKLAGLAGAPCNCLWHPACDDNGCFRDHGRVWIHGCIAGNDFSAVCVGGWD